MHDKIRYDVQAKEINSWLQKYIEQINRSIDINIWYLVCACTLNL